MKLLNFLFTDLITYITLIVVTFCRQKYHLEHEIQQSDRSATVV